MTTDHENYLREFFKELTEHGFTNVRLDDPDLSPIELDAHGADRLISEMGEVDDIVTVKADLPRTGADPDDEPHTTVMGFYLGNDAWESLVDYTIPCAAVDEKLFVITDYLEERCV